MVKNYFVILFFILFYNSKSFAQNIEAHVFEPESININIINNHHQDIILNIFIRDRRGIRKFISKKKFLNHQESISKKFSKN